MSSTIITMKTEEEDYVDPLEVSLSSSNRSKEGRRVSFNEVEIREYSMTIGDNPAVSSGPAITLDWDYNPETDVLTIEDYENSRPERRNKYQLIRPRHLREEILKFDCGVSRAEMAQCIREIKAIKAKRRQTTNNLGFAKTEEKMESLKKVCGRVIGVRKYTNKEFKLLWQQVNTMEQRSNTAGLVQ